MKRATAILCVGLCLNMFAGSVQSDFVYITYLSNQSGRDLYAQVYHDVMIYPPHPMPPYVMEFVHAHGVMNEEEDTPQFLYSLQLQAGSLIAPNTYLGRVSEYTNLSPLTLVTPPIYEDYPLEAYE